MSVNLGVIRIPNDANKCHRVAEVRGMIGYYMLQTYKPQRLLFIYL